MQKGRRALSPCFRSFFVLRAVLSILLFVFPGRACAQARAFPDTRDGIFVFSDQIPPGNTEAQNRFAASHYVGTQKMIRDDIRKIRLYNPNFLHLHYKLSIGEGDSSTYFIDGNQWVTDWDFVKNQDSWFVTDDQGTRIRQRNWGFYLMDVSGQIRGAGDNGWKEYWAGTCIDQMRHNEADGVFADSYDVAVVNAEFLEPPYWWFQGTNPAIYWVPHLDIFGSYLASRLHAEPEHFYLLPNLGYQVTSWDPADYAFGDGGMIEGFGQWGPDIPFDLSDWKLQMNRVLALIARDKVLICQSYMADALDYDDRLFYLGCYLLAKGRHTYLNIVAGGPGHDMQYYPEYGIDLGAYLQESPDDVDELLDAGAGVYRRAYAGGTVIVNPTASTRPIDLGGIFYRAIPVGGGIVNASGGYDGTLTFQQVSQISLGPCEAAILLSAPPPPAHQATDLTAFHRSGQTFLTWTETPDDGETYRIYRHDVPITNLNLSEAERTAEVAEGSAFYANEWEKETDYDPNTHALQRNFVIEDLGPEIPDSVGLLVWTPHRTGGFYYAVTAVAGGIENTNISGENSLEAPVAETDDPPSPVLVWASATGRGWVYTQFMDYAAWNPTFDGYAYNYSVGVPSNYDGATPFPLTIRLDGWGTRYQPLDGSPYDYQTIFVSIDDPHQTWYYGNAAAYDYAQGSIPAIGPIANFTEWRTLRCVDDIARGGFFVDPNRIYAFGGSMGGSGALSLGLRYPDLFAAVYGAAPMTNYKTAGDFGGLDWEGDLVPKFGPIASNFPVVNLGPHAAPLSRYDGMGVWDWMNHQAEMLSRTADEMCMIATSHGDADNIIEWQSQGAPWYEIMDHEARRGFTGAVIAGGDHYWYGFVGCGNNLPFESYLYRKDRSFPGITNCSLNTAYSHNKAIEWSCPWLDFAGDIRDTPDHYEIVLRIADIPGMPQTGTIDVTPRRLQAFVVTPGRRYLWRNESLAGETVAQGSVFPDTHGLLLIDDFIVSRTGNRLVLYPDTAAGSREQLPPARFFLAQPHPNPFVEAVTIAFDVPDAVPVSIEVFDAAGRSVRVLAEWQFTPGRHRIHWDGSDRSGRHLPAGIYLVRMAARGFEDARSLIKVRCRAGSRAPRSGRGPRRDHPLGRRAPDPAGRWVGNVRRPS